MLRDEIAPELRAAGFKGSRQSFDLPSESHWAVLGFQKSAWSDRQRVTFTVNLRGSGVSHQGGICTGETYKRVVKLTFFKGASLKDPSRLFNSTLEGNTRRAIDVHEDDEIDERAFVTLIRAAVSLNESSAR
jgi:hypothetical protein